MFKKITIAREAFSSETGQGSPEATSGARLPLMWRRRTVELRAAKGFGRKSCQSRSMAPSLNDTDLLDSQCSRMRETMKNNTRKNRSVALHKFYLPLVMLGFLCIPITSCGSGEDSPANAENNSKHHPPSWIWGEWKNDAVGLVFTERGIFNHNCKEQFSHETSHVETESSDEANYNVTYSDGDWHSFRLTSKSTMVWGYLAKELWKPGKEKIIVIGLKKLAYTRADCK